MGQLPRDNPESLLRSCWTQSIQSVDGFLFCKFLFNFVFKVLLKNRSSEVSARRSREVEVLCNRFFLGKNQPHDKDNRICLPVTYSFQLEHLGHIPIDPNSSWKTMSISRQPWKTSLPWITGTPPNLKCNPSSNKLLKSYSHHITRSCNRPRCQLCSLVNTDHNITESNNMDYVI